MLLFGGSEISERITELIKKWKTFSRIQVRNLCVQNFSLTLFSLSKM